VAGRVETGILWPTINGKLTLTKELRFSWGWESRDPSFSALSPGSSLVEIDLEPRNGGTLVRLRHSGLPDSLERIHGERWSHHLVELEAAVLESAAKRKNEPIARISKETA
jgi:uncharacterized protein YndB with AHSA1/START domain